MELVLLRENNSHLSYRQYMFFGQNEKRGLHIRALYDQDQDTIDFQNHMFAGSGYKNADSNHREPLKRIVLVGKVFLL